METFVLEVDLENCSFTEQYPSLATVCDRIIQLTKESAYKQHRLYKVSTQLVDSGSSPDMG